MPSSSASSRGRTIFRGSGQSISLGQTVSALAVKEPGRKILLVTGSTKIQSLRTQAHSLPSWSAISYTRCMCAPRTPFSQVVISSTSCARGQR